MTQTTTIDGVSRTSVIKRVECEWVDSAYLAEIGQGSIKIHDDAGNISVVGHKTIDTEQTACSSWPTLFMGFVSQKKMSRGQTYSVGAGREITVATKDGNDLLTRFVIQGSGAANGNRPAETVSARVTWILGSTFLAGLVNDYGAVTYPTTLGMDATDYRGQRPGDVLAACAKKASFNVYVRWSYTNSGWELVFRDDNASTADTSSITITNDGTANGTSSFAPFQDAELTQDPEDVYSGVVESYAQDPPYYGTRAATATAFVARDGTADDSGIKTAAAAQLEATRFLWDSHLEKVEMTVTLRMRAAYVNLIRAGQRVSVTMTHFAQEGYGSATYFRVLRRRVRQPLDTDNDYDVQLDLSPQEAGPAAAAIVQRASARGTTNGCSPTFANPLTIGNKLLVVISEYGTALPAAPATAGPLDFWGAGAWTRLNGSSRTAIDAYYSAPAGAEIYHGLAAYYKTIDATTQAGYIPGTYLTGFAWELTSSANLASATLVTKDVQTTSADPEVFNAGSLGTVAVGDLAMYACIFANNVNAGGSPTGYSGDFLPLTTVSPGSFTEQWYHGSSDSSYGPYPASYEQQTWVGDVVGTGASVTATISKAKNERNGFTFNTIGWAAIGIKVST